MPNRIEIEIRKLTHGNLKIKLIKKKIQLIFPFFSINLFKCQFFLFDPSVCHTSEKRN